MQTTKQSWLSLLPAAEAANESCSVRFQLFDEEQLEDFVASSDCENTKKQIKYSVTVFEN